MGRWRTVAGIAACLLIYILLFNHSSRFERMARYDYIKWYHMKNKMTKLKEDFINNQKELFDGVKDDSIYTINNSTKLAKINCNFNMQETPEVDVQMLDLYRQLEFDNPYGGAWAQGWEIRYDEEQWSPKKKLKVIVVPHSHNDPGWLYTFESYYSWKTRDILNNMVIKLSEDKLRKFIWAEVSFFKLWWDEQTEEIRKRVKRLIADGQLEIVAGGWVMPDEAVSHWMGQLTQLTVGHQWLKTNLGCKPTSGWAIDPFGLSPTMPYLYKNSGLQNAVIQRVHYAVKKRLARDKNLEFRWRQLWDTTGSSEILTHMIPFPGYGIQYSCGPDPYICYQFDFRKVWSWNPFARKYIPEEITTRNLDERATTLLDQYRKKAQLYKTNVLLVPLGDDFRYTTSDEWDAQYNNYQRLFDYMNENKLFHVDVKFGTLTDYFNALRNYQDINQLPSLSGDFFTYADKDEDYWSGYYTSRPFHKRLDRVLIDALRGAEVISSIAWAYGFQHLVEGNFEKRITEARQWHSLFQHHDGITGTARDKVVNDYAKKMIAALTNLAHITQQSVAHLLRTSEDLIFEPESVYLTLDQVRSHHTSIDDKQVLSFKGNDVFKKVVIYNSLPRKRERVQTLFVSTPFVKVTDSYGEPIQSQISPIWTESATLSDERYELSFVVTVAGFGLNTYLIQSVESDDKLPSHINFATVTLFNANNQPYNVPGFENIKIVSSTQEFLIRQRPDISAHFAKSGLLKSLQTGDATTSLNVEFLTYETDRGGAYLFIPNKPDPDPIYTTDDHVIHLVTGPILSRVFIQLPQVKHTCTLFNSLGSDGLGLHISNLVDITETNNFELVMRWSTNISSGNEFFTDLNGLNMIKRERFSKLPTQANYYPLPVVGYIQDSEMRLTVVTGQPLGAASMASGQFEVMQDRRLIQEDDRGLGQGVTDNLLTNHVFMLVLEKKKPSCSSSSVNHPAGVLSVGGLLASEEVLYPLIAMHPNPSSDSHYDYKDHFSPLSYDLPIGLTVANLRVFPITESYSRGIGIVLHRQPIDICWDEKWISRFKLSKDGEVNIKEIFKFTQDWIVNESSLTFNSIGASLTSPTVNLCPHELSAFILRSSTVMNKTVNIL